MKEANPAKRIPRKPIIVVIEDNADQWVLIEWVLSQQFPEIKPVWFADPAQAILYLESSLEDVLPRLILLDLYLPNHKVGWKTLELIKNHPLLREVPVVVLSQSSDPEDIKESYMHQANSYMIKPNTYQEWLTTFTHFRHYWWNVVTLPTVL